MERKKEQALLLEISEAINNYSFDFNAFATEIAAMHPTIQQRFFKLIKACILFMAAEGNVHIDDRNRSSYQMCKELEPWIKDACLPLI